MFAIVEIGGNQYRVQPGEKVVVDRLHLAVGETINYPAILVAEGEDVKIGKDAQSVSIITKIVSHDLGEKIHIRHFRAKSRSRRHVGFRPKLTTLSVESIGGAAPVVAKAEKTETAKPLPRRQAGKAVRAKRQPAKAAVSA